jgi:DNA-binding NarL/FixJ family response regulator
VNILQGECMLEYFLVLAEGLLEAILLVIHTAQEGDLRSMMTQEGPGILLAVEATMFRQVLGALLEAASFHPLTWTDTRFGQSEVPSIAILDAAMGDARMFEMMREFGARFPGMPWLLLVDHEGEPDVIEALHAGMRGYLLKTQPGAQMVDAVRAVLGGGLYLSPVILRTLIPRLLTTSKTGVAKERATGGFVRAAHSQGQPV